MRDPERRRESPAPIDGRGKCVLEDAQLIPSFFFVSRPPEGLRPPCLYSVRIRARCGSEPCCVVVEVLVAVASAAAPYQSRSTASTVKNKKKAQAHTFYRWGCTSAFSMVQVMLVPLEHSEVGPREGREVRDPGEKTESTCKTHVTLSFLFVCCRLTRYIKLSYGSTHPCTWV